MANNIDEYLAQRATQSLNAPQNDSSSNPLEQVLERDHDEQFNLATHTEDVVLVALKLLRPYPNRVFKPYSGEKMDSMVQSIRRDGLHHPIIIREVEGTYGFEILDGHNRVEAIRRFGERDIKALVRRGLTDSQAALIAVAANLEQRIDMLPSEKAFAYKLQMEALQCDNSPIVKRGRDPNDTSGSDSSVQFEPGLTSREVAAEMQGVSNSEIQRYIRLTFLLPALLELVDQKKIPIMAGYEVSFLDIEAQQVVYQYFFEHNAKDRLTLKKAELIRAIFQAGKPVTAASIPDMLPKKKPGPKVWRFSAKVLKQYTLPDDFDLEAFVHSALAKAFPRWPAD